MYNIYRIFITVFILIIISPWAFAITTSLDIENTVIKGQGRAIKNELLFIFKL